MRRTEHTANQYHPRAACEFRGPCCRGDLISKQKQTGVQFPNKKHTERFSRFKKKRKGEKNQGKTWRANKQRLMVFKVSICFSVFHCQVRREEGAAERMASCGGWEGHGWDYSASGGTPYCGPDMPTSLQCIFLWQCRVTDGQKSMKCFFFHTCWGAFLTAISLFVFSLSLSVAVLVVVFKAAKSRRKVKTKLQGKHFFPL